MQAIVTDTRALHIPATIFPLSRYTARVILLQ